MQRAATELRAVYLGLAHAHRMQESQSRRISASLESMNSLTRRIGEALNEIKHSHIFTHAANASFECMVLDRLVREIDLLEQQQNNIIEQISNSQSLPQVYHQPLLKSMPLDQ